ncbi:MAG: LytTR family transcriptional regulator [Ruminococcaceae bacterium]|nr:LytTR family transcriptional regulator [Oscillospiraceae bacterium]
MKVTFESANLAETEVIIKGDIADPEAMAVLEFIKSRNSVTKKLMLYREDEQFLLSPSEVVYIEASDNKVQAITTSGIYDTKKKLYELKEQLGAEPFAQINKGTLVNIDFVKSVQAEFSGNYSLRLKQGKEILTISRKYFKEFKSKI